MGGEKMYKNNSRVASIRFNQWRHAWKRNNMKECIKQTDTLPFKLAF